MGKELDDAVAKLDKVTILRSPERKGLVNARLMGARTATGDVLVFLDAHCEVSLIPYFWYKILDVLEILQDNLSGGGDS